ncbi:DUF6056 family protein [Nonlabens agnitus]|uniref:Glycosyltransferase RgtA/B/C/D-like domain-containing protein n=1 Tax=Nonlabens agnitus TaxID=870484 RepID=A0A2S9WU51_9FLAO|nr:DUF6056 family protein [Nonlabens agnitus]PRP67005.1 hypothetical protein BST86_07780 [Nonlabens agnitus]
MLQLDKNSHQGLMIIILLGFFVVIPFLFVVKYATLSADDFPRAVFDIQDFFRNYSSWYKMHNGRFVNAFFSLLPIYSPTPLRLMLFINFVFNFIALRFFLFELFSFYGIQVSKKVNFIATIVFFSLLIVQMPSLVDYFYWYASMTVYSISFCCFLMTLAYLFKMMRGDKRAIIWSMLFSILAIGSSELFILLLNSIVAVFLFVDYINRKQVVRSLIYLQLIVIAASVLVILSPGSANRQQAFEQSGNFINALSVTWREILFFFSNEFSNLQDYLTYSVIVMLIALVLIKSKNSVSLKYINPLILLLFSITLLICILFTPSYAMGGLPFNYGRVGNLIHLLWLVIVLVNTINLMVALKKQQWIDWSIGEYWCLPTLLVLLTTSVVRSSNVNNIYDDLINDRFEKSENDRNDRLLRVINSREVNIVLEPMMMPKTLQYTDVTSNPDHWYNKSYVNYFNAKYDININTVRVENKTASAVEALD